MNEALLVAAIHAAYLASSPGAARERGEGGGELQPPPPRRLSVLLCIPGQLSTAALPAATAPHPVLQKPNSALGAVPSFYTYHPRAAAHIVASR